MSARAVCVQHRKLVGTGAFILVATIGLGFSLLGISETGLRWEDADAQCGGFPGNGSLPLSFSAHTELASFRKTYALDLGGAAPGSYIQKQCPSASGDVDVFVGGKLAVRGDRLLVSTVARTNVYDCHRNLLWVLRTGNVGDAVIAGVTTQVSLEARAPNGSILAFSDTTNFWGTKIAIKDATKGAQVASISFGFARCDFTIDKPGTTAADPRLLAVIAGLRAFDKGAGDVCNSYFSAVTILLICVGGALLLGLGALALWLHKRRQARPLADTDTDTDTGRESLTASSE